MEVVSNIKSIAVLPFANQSGQADQDYLSDGFTEEIINALSQLEGLKVTSRTSSFYFKNKNEPLTAIATALGVGIIIEGSVRVAENRMRISASIIDVEEDVQFWSESFERSTDDIFAIQDEISLLIAEHLREYLGHFELGDQLLIRPDASAQSYQAYLQSRYHLLKMGKADIAQGLEILESILEKDPNYAHAHLGIHMAYTLLGTLGLVPATEAFAKGQPHLEAAIRLQPALPECQINLAWNAFLQGWNFIQTYHHLQQSVQIRPTTDYYQTMASTLSAEGRFKAAHYYIDLALEVDPFSHIGHHLKGFIYYGEHKYEQALQYFDQSLKLNPQASVSINYRGQALIAAGQPEKSLDFFLTHPDDQPGDIINLAGLALSYAAIKDEANTIELLDQIEAFSKTDLMGRATQVMVMIYCTLGEHEQALEWMRKGMKRRLPLLVYTFTDPLLEPLHQYNEFRLWKQEVIGSPVEIEQPTRKYKQTLLNKAEQLQYKQQLESLMQKEEPFLDPKLSLRELATQMSIPANQLSQLLNEGFRQNFSEFINSYRLETFKQKAGDPKQQHLTLLAMAYDSGFNSKTVFNTFFKKKMGMTPRSYWKQITED